MENHTTHIRRVHRRPGWDGSPTHPGKVSTDIAVGVRLETTLQRMRFGAVVTRDLPELYVPAAVGYFQTTTYYG